MKCRYLIFFGLAACSSLRAPHPLTSASPQKPFEVRDLGALSLSKEWRGDLYRAKDVARKDVSKEDLPWRGRGTIGSPMQSYVAPRILSENRVLVALLGEGIQMRDLRSGALLWSYVKPIGVGAEPLVVEPFVYVAGMDSQVAKLRLDTGEVLWTRKLNVESTGGLAMDVGVVYVTTSDNAVWALDDKTGSPLWSYRRPSPTGSLYWSLRGSSKPLVSADGTKVFAGFSDGSVVAVNTHGGDLAWERVLQSRSNLFKDADLGPLLSPDGGVLFIGQVDGDLVAINSKDGGILWKRALQIVNAPGLSPDSKSLYVSSLSGELHLIRASDATEVWSVSHPAYGLASRATPVSDGLVAVAWTAGPLTLIDASDGKIVWTSADKIQTVAPPSSDGQRLLALSSRNQLYRFVLNFGKATASRP
ncbi:MAG: PQQ-binding-like beta-propeller repeat protein [Bdellovibrionota bacterium]